MYLKVIALKNIGPINEAVISPDFGEDGKPKPVVIVGENGAGKTILQSCIVDALYELLGKLFDDISVKIGNGHYYYKSSGALNIMLGQTSGFSILQFKSDTGKCIEYFDKHGKVPVEDLRKLIVDFSSPLSQGEDTEKYISIPGDVLLKINQYFQFYKIYCHPSFSLNSAYPKMPTIICA